MHGRHARHGWWRLALAAGVALAGSAAVGAVSPGAASNGLVVHEWGTFLSMQGSDGVSLDGMYHEEHALPAFVHARSRDQLRLPAARVKGETPVIYFYTDQARKVSVTVRFPQGIWTQWYPQASLVGPGLAQTSTPLEPRRGSITWEASLRPAGKELAAMLPATAPDSLWRYAREVDAAYVQTSQTVGGKAHTETERYLFYRGLGQATPPLRMTAAEGGSLTWEPSGPAGGQHLFVVRVEKGRGAYRYLPAMAPGQTVSHVVPDMKDARPLEEFVTRLSDDLARRLEESGLYAKEARAMVNTWRDSYFRTEGLRVLYVLPQSWTDAFIPMELDPQPRELVRVMVGRLEALTPEREQRAANAVRDLASDDNARREQAFQALLAQGRYVEPLVRRTLNSTDDERTRALCRRLLLTGFVTELRSALQAPASIGPLRDQPLHVRAQLAALLRESGLDAQARAEAAPVLEAFKSRPEPDMSSSGTRHVLRAMARALEGAGDDSSAAAAYAKFVRYGSQVKEGNCGGCHFNADTPRNRAWFRDWYAGRKFAALSLKTAGPEVVRKYEEELRARPNDDGTRMLLAYLYEATGKSGDRERMWASLGAASDTVASRK